MLQEQEADRAHALVHMCVHVAACAHTQQQETILKYANEGWFFFFKCVRCREEVSEGGSTEG